MASPPFSRARKGREPMINCGVGGENRWRAGGGRVERGRMHLHWLDPTSLDRRDVDAVAAVWEMSRAADAPGDRASTALSVRATLKYGWDLNPAQTAVF